MKLPKELQRRLSQVKVAYTIERTNGGHYRITNSMTGAFTFISASPRNTGMYIKMLDKDLRRIGLR
jgi:hypothetical protein